MASHPVPPVLVETPDPVGHPARNDLAVPLTRRGVSIAPWTWLDGGHEALIPQNKADAPLERLQGHHDEVFLDVPVV